MSLFELGDDVDQVAEAAAEAVQPSDDEGVAGAQVVEAGLELRSLPDRAGADVAEDPGATGLLKRVELEGEV